MSQRLPPIPGEWIDRNQVISFTFEGTTYSGYAGDTISAALWGAGVRTLGRSFKYHRPRGLLSLANHDVNSLMQSGDRLNLRADVTPIEPGMTLTAINTWGGVAGDRAGILDAFSRLMPVGFYYKAFHQKALFPFWEKAIRQITGLGKLDLTAPRHRTAKRYDFCEVLVIGAGVAGLAAALAAAEAGANVVLVDENAQTGGSGHFQREDDDRLAQVQALRQAVQSHPKIRLYLQTQAAGYYADGWVPLVRRDYLVKLRARSVVVATGAYEQPAVFRQNDLPGIMLASAAQRLIYRYAVKPMQRAIVLTANEDGDRAALNLLSQGVQIQAIVDLRSQPPACNWRDRLRQLQIPIFTGYCIYEARSNPAKDGVASVVICPQDAAGNLNLAAKEAIDCDGIVMSVGWSPAANLLYQAGAKFQFEPALQQFVPQQLPDRMYACGRVNGVYDCREKWADGERAGRAAAEGKAVSVSRSLALNSPSHPYPIVPHPQGKNFVDFDEDLQLKDFVDAAQEGFDSIELLKRYTTVGMGPSQGKHSNLNALRILAKLTGKTPDELGTTTARPFVHPVPMSHLAGRGFHPVRQTPLHDRHQALGATWMSAGAWQRPEFYGPIEQREACIQAEVQAVRSRAGLIDVGTLGKLEIRGPDAAAFLERVYTGRFANLKIGMTRYAVMLDETGVIIDDGVVARLSDEQFYFTTTTSGAAGIYRELTRLNIIWGMNCGIVNLTGSRSAVNLAGPNSCQILASLTDLDLSTSQFPYLAVRSARVAGIPALLMRVGFVGEWGYEIHVAAEAAPALWDALMQAGSPFGIAPFGVAAQRLLRLEKGHLIVGQDTDGLTTPIEAGLSWAVKLDKPFFVGQRSLQAIRSRPLKQKLVGFVLNSQFNSTPPQECHLIVDQQGETILGRVTSVGFSSSLNQFIGLAYVDPNYAHIGNLLSIRLTNGSIVMATVSATPFYDPENARQQDPAPRREEAIV